MPASAQKSDRAGILISMPLGSDKVIQSDIVQCAHCDLHWQWQPGSGRIRGRCMRCGGLTCGRPFCEAMGCTHREQRIENMEAGRAFDFRPITISLAGISLG